jgi:hypothetical protein
MAAAKISIGVAVSGVVNNSYFGFGTTCLHVNLAELILLPVCCRDTGFSLQDGVGHGRVNASALGHK